MANTDRRIEKSLNNTEGVGPYLLILEQMEGQDEQDLQDAGRQHNDLTERIIGCAMTASPKASDLINMIFVFCGAGQ